MAGAGDYVLANCAGNVDRAWIDPVAIFFQYFHDRILACYAAFHALAYHVKNSIGIDRGWIMACYQLLESNVLRIRWL